MLYVLETLEGIAVKEDEVKESKLLSFDSWSLAKLASSKLIGLHDWTSCLIKGLRPEIKQLFKNVSERSVTWFDKVSNSC